MLAPHKIFIVEDSLQDRVMLEALLTESFEHLKFSNRLDSALQEAKDFDPDLILLDLNLPDSSGTETFDTLNRLFPNKIIIITGIDDTETALQTIQEGALDYIDKHDLLNTQVVKQIQKNISRKKWIDSRLGK